MKKVPSEGPCLWMGAVFGGFLLEQRETSIGSAGQGGGRHPGWRRGFGEGRAIRGTGSAVWERQVWAGGELGSVAGGAQRKEACRGEGVVKSKAVGACSFDEKPLADICAVWVDVWCIDVVPVQHFTELCV